MATNLITHAKIDTSKWIGYTLIGLTVFLIFLGKARAPWLLFDLLFMMSFVYVCFSQRLTQSLINIGILLGINFVFLFIQLYTFGLTPLALFRFYYNIRFIFIIYFFAQLIRNEEIDIKKILYHIYIIGCIQFFLNIPFIVREYLAEPWNIDEHNGLFGNGSSHATGIFWLFLINYGLLRDKYKMLTIALIFISIFLSSLTDNKFFYVGLVVSVGIYMFKNPRLIIQTITLSTLTVIVVVVCYNSISEFQIFLDKVIFRSFDLYLNSDNEEKAERTRIFEYILMNRQSFHLGQGLGIVSHIFDIDGKRINVLEHISMNEAFIQIYETGIVNTIVQVVTFALTFSLLWDKNRIIVFLVMVLLIVAMFFYSRFITDPRQIFFFALIVICYALPNFAEKKIKKKVIKRYAGMNSIPV